MPKIILAKWLFLVRKKKEEKRGREGKGEENGKEKRGREDLMDIVV